MKIYTKSGDKGETSLFGGQRVSKNDVRIESYGTVDELNSILGMAICEIENPELKSLLISLQNELFQVGSDLATPRSDSGKDSYIKRIDGNDVVRLENLIDRYSENLPELKYFILPGGSRGASWLHMARTVCRRAERKVVELNISIDIGDALVVYLNRLSDLFFVLARYANHVTDTPDVKWQK